MQKILSGGAVLMAVAVAFLVLSAMAPNTKETNANVPKSSAGDGAASRGALSVGPDVTIIELSGISSYDSGSPCPSGYSGNCRGYAVGTDSCNIGSVPVDWCDNTSGCRTTTDPFHPIAPATVSDVSVIAQNMYRLKDGRFEQIGMSFLKHGFVSTNSSNSQCAWNDNGNLNTSCVSPPAGGDQLGLGCTDFYGSGLNGGRPLGRRSDVHVAGGDHPFEAGGETDNGYDQRIVIAEEDLDPAQNAGAQYWMEGHYVVRDDARAGNGLNNASYRPASVGSLPSLTVSLTGSTVRELPAIFAWQAEDPMVEIVQADRNTSFVGEEADAPIAPGTFYPDYTIKERFHVARRVTEESRGGALQYHYEYAVYNMNSDTSADGFVVDFPGFADFENVGFNDIDHHSGEPYNDTDWSIDANELTGTITWSAADAGVATNALRWGTMFSFWFDSDQPPSVMTHQLDLYKIDEMLNVPFGGGPPPATIFEDGFETGDTSNWAP